MPVTALAGFVFLGVLGGSAASNGNVGATCPSFAALVNPAAIVGWPPSTNLVVSEVVTGGASASDEFVEIYNASAQPIDLAGLELVYVTSTGSTVTRKQTWTSMPLAGHTRLLLANSLGAYAAVGADGLYSGGFSATGGSLVLRQVGGTVIDSLSWGEAASSFVEGTAGIAPAAGWSLERLPGGDAGNATDTNDNVADTWVNSSPVAHSSAAPPVPGPAPSPSPTALPTDTPTASATLEPTPTMEPTPSASVEPTATATDASPSAPATPLPEPTATSTPCPLPSTFTPSPVPTPASPTPTHTASPVPSPTAAPISIASARSLAVGSVASVRGVVTVAPGWILGDATTAIQDATGGIYVRLPAMPFDGIVPGRVLEVTGALAAPYGNLELRPATGGVRLLGAEGVPAPSALAADQLGEATEGLLARVEGTIRRIEGGLPSSLTLIVEDASGEGRVFAHATLGIERGEFAVGQRISAIGLVGDRLGLYRIWPRNRFDVTLEEPAPTATPTPRPTPRPTPTRPPTPTATPTARPSNAPPLVSISAALRRQGDTLTVDGVATTRNGLLDADGERITIQDASAAILVRLPEGISVQAGQRLRVTGEVGTYYGAPQLTATAVSRHGDTSVDAMTVRAAPLAAALEWRLVKVTGTVESVRRDGDAWRAELLMSGGGIPVVGLARSGIDATALQAGRVATITGIVKRAYPTASDQRFAVVPRAAADIALGPASPTGSPADDPDDPGDAEQPTPSATGENGPLPPAAYSSTGSTPAGAGIPAVALADLAAYEGEMVRAGGRIVGRSAERIVIDDGTATAGVRLAGEAAAHLAALRVADLVNVRGAVARDADGSLEIVVDEAAAIAWSERTSASDAATSPPGVPAAQAPAPLAAAPTASPLDTRGVAVVLLLLACATFALAVAAGPERRQRVRTWLVRGREVLRQRPAAPPSG